MPNTVTTTELRRDTAGVYNQVQTTGWVRIVHRDRPDMVLVTQEELDALLKQQYDLGKKEKAA